MGNQEIGRLYFLYAAIFDIVDDELVFRSYYKMPAPQTEQENCVAHNGSLVPVPGRDIMVQAWYQGGISVFDFTDPADPVEIAFFDRGPIDEEELVTGGFWSAYWHNGLIYGTEIVRGLDVLELTESEHLSGNEIAAALVASRQETFNPQQQFQVAWPAEPVVARAYRDQLRRAGRLADPVASRLDGLLDRAEAVQNTEAHDPGLAEAMVALGAELESEAVEHEGITRQRLRDLAATLAEMAGRLD